LIFADPPYMYPHVDKLVDKIWERKLLSEIGFFVLEHDSGIVFVEDMINFAIETRRDFGKTAITIFKHKG